MIDRATYSVETSGGITIALDLNSCVHSIGDIGAKDGFIELNMRKTESTQSLDFKGLMKGNVVVGSRIGTQCQENLDSSLGMTHGQCDGERTGGNRELRTIAGLGSSAAGELGHLLFRSITAGRILELEVGGDQGRKRRQVENRELHDGEGCVIGGL